MWNPNAPGDALRPGVINGPYPSAPVDALRLGAIDTICVYLEKRGYNNVHIQTLDYIERHFRESDQVHHVHRRYVLEMLPSVKSLLLPPLEVSSIKDIEDFPNIGLLQRDYERIMQRMHETIQMLRTRHGYTL